MAESKPLAKVYEFYLKRMARAHRETMWALYAKFGEFKPSAIRDVLRVSLSLFSEAEKYKNLEGE